MIRTSLVVSLAAVAITVGAVACSSSDSTPSSGTTTTTTKLPDGGTETTTTTNGFKNCGSTTTTTTSSCTTAELQTYGTCVQKACDADYQKCFGADYASGKFSGDCGDYITCSQACACDDDACAQNCEQKVVGACQTCLQTSGLATCSQTCTPPACETATTPDAGSTGTPTVASCVKLATCCTKIAAGAEQDACNQTADTNFDSTCTQAYSAYAGQAQSGQTCAP